MSLLELTLEERYIRIFLCSCLSIYTKVISVPLSIETEKKRKRSVRSWIRRKTAKDKKTENVQWSCGQISQFTICTHKHQLRWKWCLSILYGTEKHCSPLHTQPPASNGRPGEGGENLSYGRALGSWVEETDETSDLELILNNFI